MSASRRSFIWGTSSALAGVACATAAQMAEGASLKMSTAQQPARPPHEPGKYPLVAISSENGVEATRLAYKLMQEGQDPLDAAIAGVNLVEDDPNDTSVGYGGLPNEEGVVELDAAVMHGPTHQAGAVASLQKIRYPSKVAKLVMTQSDHVLIVGEGALRFARAHGFVEENLLTEKARKIWLYWRQSHSDQDDWLQPPDSELDPDVASFFKRPTGTIHLAAMNSQGDISCTTTTSGLAFKIPGRVGDSPIIGAGLFVDNAIGSCGSTGRGEANLQNMSSHAGVELMRQGKTPQDAGLEILRRVVAHTVPRLLQDGRPTFDLKFYLLAKDGTFAGVSMYGPAKFAVTDKNGSRLEDCVSLFDR